MVKPGETQRLSDLVSITQLLDLNLEILASELIFIPITILCLNNSSFNGQLNSLGEEKGLRTKVGRCGNKNSEGKHQEIWVDENQVKGLGLKPRDVFPKWGVGGSKLYSRRDKLHLKAMLECQELHWRKNFPSQALRLGPVHAVIG